MTAEIHFNNCTLQYRGSEVLTNVSLDITKGSNVALHGPIGSGKSMVLRAIAGIAQITSGELNYLSNGVSISKAEFHSGVSLVDFAKTSKFFNPKNHFYQQRYHHQMEDDEWSKSITVSQLLTTRGYSLDAPQVKEYLKRVKLIDLLETKMIQLSSGQRRKLQLTIALLTLPAILLLDSPYIGLDQRSRVDLNNWLLELTTNNDLQLIIACNTEDAPEWINHRIEIPSTQKIAGNHEFPFLNHNLQVIENEESIVDHILEMRNINVSFGDSKLLTEVDLKITKGERIALLGDNGSGKSTLLSLLYADNPKAYSNDIKMFGVKRGQGDSIWSVKKRIGFVSSELHLYFTENYNCAKVIATGFFDTKFIPRKITSEEQSTIEQFANYFGVSHLLDITYSKTSLGEQKLILFIRALVKNPELILLDEPYQAFTSALVYKANSLLNHMLQKSNSSIVFVTHYRSEIPSSVQKIYQLNKGKMELEVN